MLKNKAGREFWWGAPVSSNTNVAFCHIKRGLKGTKTVNHINIASMIGDDAVLRSKSADKLDNLVEGGAARQRGWERAALNSGLALTRPAFAALSPVDLSATAGEVKSERRGD